MSLPSLTVQQYEPLTITEVPFRPLSDADLDDLAVEVALHLGYDLDAAIDLMPHQYQRVSGATMTDAQADRLKGKVLDRCAAEFGGRLPVPAFSFAAVPLDQQMSPENDGRMMRAMVYGFLLSLPLWAVIVVAARYLVGGR